MIFDGVVGGGGILLVLLMLEYDRMFGSVLVVGMTVDCSLSTVIMGNDKSNKFHQYQRYSHKCGTIAFSTPFTIV